MLGRLFDRFRRRVVLVPGTASIPEGEARKVELDDVLAGGKQIVLCRVGGKLHALDAVCPHEGGRILGGALVEGKYAICPLHNYLFDPRTGNVVRGACANAVSYRVRERGGDCEVRV